MEKRKRIRFNDLGWELRLAAFWSLLNLTLFLIALIYSICEVFLGGV